MPIGHEQFKHVLGAAATGDGMLRRSHSMIAWAAAVAVVYGAVLFLAAYRYARRQPHIRAYPPTGSGPRVSVIIPARNEAANIERCVSSVLRAAYAPVEVVVVDDRSTDETAAILDRLAAAPEAAGRLRIVRGSEPPAGWFGKPWAIVQGFRVSTGDLLLFADADTRHEPELLGRSVAALAAERVELLSVIPRQEVGSFWECLIQPQVFFILQSRVGDLRRVNRTRVPWDAIANGQFILTTRAAYEAVGTHQAVKDQVAEDVALAQAYVRAGRDVFLVHAPELMSTRMYRSLREIIEGWSKNLALGAPLMMPPVRWLRHLAPYIMWIPSLVWIVPPLVWALTGWAPAAVATVLSLATWLVIYRNERAPLIYALLYPLGSIVVAGIMIRSAIRGGRRVEWKGRTYRTRS